MKISDPAIVEEKSIQGLFLTALQFCVSIETVQSFEKDVMIGYLLKICSLLYMSGSTNLEMLSEDNSAAEQFLTEEEYEQIYLSLKEKWQEMEFFEFYNRQLNEMETKSACELLADIYQDMKNFVLQYQKNSTTAKKAAASLLKENFPHHWGKNLLILLPYLHQLSFPEEEEFIE
ncbi:MAG: DUF5063 domain-containing protein [Bacteroidales bacterium]|jgi:hypothetical protein|nr:DUF5063 domain-containing protein [Bacteroidales bacterium]